MMFAPLSSLTIGQLPDIYSNSEPSIFGELLKNPEAELIYLIELQPYDSLLNKQVKGASPLGFNTWGDIDFSYNGGIEQVYISDKGYITEPHESPANQSYLPLTTNPFQFDVSILSGEEFRGGVPSFGAIRILNGDGSMEALTQYKWSGRYASVYVGGVDFERANFAKIFSGLCTQPEFNEDEIIINVSDKTNILETGFEQNLYLGTGDLEGGSDIEGITKPLLYGECKNIAPILVDAANLIYQIHDGSMEGVTAVYDKGVALTADGDVSDITLASVGAGKFKTQLSGGYIKLGSSPDGTITADAKGDNEGGYVDNAGAILSRLVTTKLGYRNFIGNDIDQGALNNIDQTVTGSVGIYINSNTTLKVVIDSLFNGLQCYWVFTRQGMLTGGVLDAPSSFKYTITEQDIEDNGIEISRVIEPSWRVSIGYGRSWTTQSSDNLAGGATSAYKTFVSESFRKITSETRNVRTLSVGATERLFNSYLVDESDALNELDRFKRIYGVERQVFKVSLNNLLFRVFIGDEVQLKINRFGLNNGKNFIITAITEDAESGKTIMELWG